ncbi:adenylyltransferase/cytidyltransferase family protein [Nocardiopsis alba]|uniref:adenylyltransferase/cytidyltransferase family protein n=1 Tax=Nocardiopsis alba TaxID=53437 RepID=UPI00366F81DE
MVGLTALTERAREARNAGFSIALCHGCFDLFHVGHVHHLNRAAELADVLIVSVSSDEACRKGPGRPVYRSEDRTALVAALEMVDHAHTARGRGPMDVIRAVRPDIYVKGPDYATRPCVRVRAEAALVERLGGRIAFTDAEITASSTEILRRAHG